MKRHLVLVTSIAFSPVLTGFVLLGKKDAKLAASYETPTITFFWSTTANAPTLKDKQKFMNGVYASATDEELTPILIQEAMDQWNQVRGSYLRFELSTTADELGTSQDDHVNNIVVVKTNNASEAAHASPKVDGSTIVDCDITINDIKTSAISFLTTVTHELGHCVGLGHPHSNYGSIMSYSRTGDSYRLSADDKAGAIFLYPDPNYVPSEPDELIGCGTIVGRAVDQNSGVLLWLMLAIPVAWQIARRGWARRRAIS